MKGVEKALHFVSKVINMATDDALAKGITITPKLVKELRGLNCRERAQVFAFIAEIPGYYVSVMRQKGKMQEIPAAMWRSEHFADCVYDGFENVFIQIKL